MSKFTEKLVSTNSGIMLSVVIITVTCVIFHPPAEVLTLAGISLGIFGALAKKGE